MTDCGGADMPCQVSDRHYNALIPIGDGPFPAIVFLHGSNGSGQKTVENIDLVQPFLNRGYAVIAPTALEIEYRNGPGTGWVWDSTRYSRDDFRFVADVVEDAIQRFSIQPDGILVAGHSRGGSFAWYLACSEVDPRLKTFAPIGGTPMRRQPGPCATASFDFDLLYMHGYADSVIPFAGTDSSLRAHNYMGAVEAADGMAYKLGCDTVDLTQGNGFDQRTYHGCRSVAEKERSLSVIGFQGGHSVPTGWADLILNWFEGLADHGQ